MFAVSYFFVFLRPDFYAKWKIWNYILYRSKACH